MKIDFDIDNHQVTYKISGFAEKFVPILEMCFWKKTGTIYTKTFKRPIQNLETCMENFRQHAFEMFSQLGYFMPVPWQNALLEFLKRVDGTDIDWWLTGSCAACIRGIKLDPHDVDIMIDSGSIEKINNLFADCIVIPIVDTNGWLTKDFGVIFKHARIDIASDPSKVLNHPEPVDCSPYAKEHLETVQWEGYKIKVPPVTLQINANKLRDRTQRVELLTQYIGKKT